MSVYPKNENLALHGAAACLSSPPQYKMGPLVSQT
jgi:hypothetical protein